MATPDLTQENFDQTLNDNAIPTLLVFREKVILFQQAGALPATALEQVITQAKAVDMAKAREELKSQEQKQNEK